MSARAARWFACALLCALPPVARGEEGTAAPAGPLARAADLLERKVEARRVFLPALLTLAGHAQVEGLLRDAHARRAAGDGGGELAALAAAARSIEGRPDDPLHDVAGALAIRLDHHLQDGAAPLEVAFEWLHPPLRRPDGPCTLEVELAKGTPFGSGGPLQRIELLAQQELRLAQGASLPALTVTVDPRHRGSFFVSALLRGGDGATAGVLLPAPLACAPGLRTEIAALEERRKALLAACAPGDAAAREALALAELPADLLREVERGARQLGEALLEPEVERARELLDAVAAGRAPDPWQGRSRHVVRHPVTGELVPWLAWMPPGARAEPRTQRPLVVVLHGLGAREESWFQYGGGLLEREAQARGWLVVAPHGWRADGFWMGRAEEALLAVVDAACARLPVDRARIALVGHSMGAFGTLRVAARHPERFAALGAIAGGGRFDWLEGAGRVPALLVHGDADRTVPAALSRTLAAVAKSRGLPWRYSEIAGAGHVDVVARSLKDVLDHCATAFGGATGGARRSR